MPVPRRVGLAIRSVSHLVRNRIDQTILQNETHGITGMQAWIIGYLYRHREAQDSFQHDLEIEFNVRRSTATGLLQRMERDGLIVREPIASDARRKKITLTPKAVGIHESVMRVIDRVEQKITGGLTAGETDALFAILDKIQKNLE
jgi:DNA-binding MarR family transcriptional regulator